jgi:hypothetical protein
LLHVGIESCRADQDRCRRMQAQAIVVCIFGNFIY